MGIQMNSRVLLAGLILASAGLSAAAEETPLSSISVKEVLEQAGRFSVPTAPMSAPRAASTFRGTSRRTPQEIFEFLEKAEYGWNYKDVSDSPIDLAAADRLAQDAAYTRARLEFDHKRLACSEVRTRYYAKKGVTDVSVAYDQGELVGYLVDRAVYERGTGVIFDDGMSVYSYYAADGRLVGIRTRFFGRYQRAKLMPVDDLQCR